MEYETDTSVARRVVYGAFDQAYNDKIDRKYHEALAFHKSNFQVRPERQAYDLGTALWLTGAYDLACQRWLVEIERLRKREAQSTDGAGGVLDPAMLWWASGHEGLEEFLKPSLSEIKKRLKTKRCQQSVWPGAVAKFIMGAISGDELVETAVTSHPHPTIIGRRTTQAWFYVSGAHLHAGNLQGYYECLNKSCTIVVGLLDDEWFLARYEVERRA